MAARCSNYEFEDVVSEVDAVDRFDLCAGDSYKWIEPLVRRCYWYPGLRNFARVNPGLKPIHVQREYEAFVFICMKPSDLIYLEAVSGWQRCKVKICYLVELWPSMIEEHGFHLSLLRQFDFIFLGFTGAIPLLQEWIKRPCFHVPLGADVFRFTPAVKPQKRVIDVLSMGRRSELAHKTLLDLVNKEGLFYLHDTIPGSLVQPNDHVEHRRLLGNCARRSKFFVAYPAKFGHDKETQGQSEVGARFFEGAASGAVIVGDAPKNPVFNRDFPWRDAVVRLGE